MISEREAERRRKIAEVLRERNRTPEMRAAISGDLNPSKRPDVRAKISAAKRGQKYTAEHRAKISAAARNRSPEHRAKISAAKRGNHDRVDGPAERSLAGALDRAGVEYLRQAPTIGQGYGRHCADFLIGDLVVEVDGPGHDRIDQWRKDRALDRQLIDAGYRVLRVDNDRVLEDPDGCARIIVSRP